MTPGDARTSNSQRRRKEWIFWRRGFVASVILHVFFFFLLHLDVPPVSPFAAAGPRAGDDRAAAGGGMEAVTLTIAEARPIPRPPPPIFSPDGVVVEEIVLDPMTEAAADMAGLLATMGGPPGLGPPGPGLENGTGAGDGGNAEEGRFRITPPSPRGMIIPPTNRNLRGREVEVWVWVSETGRVVADSTHLRPPTSDRDFNRRLIEEAARWVFEPAKRGGVPVAAWFPYTVSM